MFKSATMVFALSKILRHGVSRIRIPPAALTINRNYADMRAWKPGPIPKTEEERRIAAAKYNMIPEDYDVWSEEEGYGDYPKFPELGYDAKDPYDDYDDEYDRYFYGEPIHIDAVLWGPAGINPNMVTHRSIWYYFFLSFGSVFVFQMLDALFCYYDIRINANVKPKQYPGEGKVHYTFDPEYD